MKKIIVAICSLAAYSQTVSLSDTLTNAVGGGSFTGRITVTLNVPGSASPLYYSTTSLTGWQAVYCLGVTGSDCTTTTAAGVFAATLYANSTITPAGTSYSARFTPAKGSPWSEVWVVTPSTTTLRQIRATTIPTPTTTFQSSQLALAAGSMVYGSSAGVGTALAAGTNGQVLALSGGYPAWTTNIAGNAGTATALAANGTNCAAGTFPLGVDASGNSESCTALPTAISGTANQITASASTGAVTLSLPTTITGLTSVTSTGFTGALTGNASTATALASTVASGRIWYGNGTGAPGSTSTFVYDSANGRLGVGTASPASTADVVGTVRAASVSSSAGDPSSGSGIELAYRSDLGYGQVLAYNRTGGAFLNLRITSGFTALTQGNVAIGTTTDGNYKLDVQKSGSTGTLRVYDQTATTGSTLAVIQAGAGQSGNLLSVRNNAGVDVTKIDQYGDIGIQTTSSGGVSIGAVVGGVTLGSANLFGFTASSSGGTRDLGLARNAAGVLEINNGTAGTYRDLRVRSVFITQSTPSASTDACTAGALWADATYIYACTASGTIKRATLASF